MSVDFGDHALAGRWRSERWFEVPNLVPLALYAEHGPDSGRDHPTALTDPVEWGLPLWSEMTIAKRDDMFVSELDVVAWTVMARVTKKPLSIAWLEMRIDEVRGCEVPVHQAGVVDVVYIDTAAARIYAWWEEHRRVFPIGMDVVTEIGLEVFPGDVLVPAGGCEVCGSTSDQHYEEDCFK